MLKVALIGAGYWGPNWARVLAEVGEAELVAVADRRQESLDLIRSRYPGASVTTDPNDVFAAEDVDAVIVSTPTSTHYQLVGRALDAGKHVLCEKPLATSSAEAKELADLAEQADGVLFVGHTFVFNPAVQALAALIRAGELGTPLYFHSTRTGLGPIRSDVNVVWDLAPHDIAILLYLVDEPVHAVTAVGKAFLAPDREDVAFGQLQFASGALAGLHVSWLDPHKVRRLTCVGDKKMAVFDDVATDEKLKIFDRGASYEVVSEQARGADFGEFHAIVRRGDIVSPTIPAREPLRAELDAFIAACTTGDVPRGANTGFSVDVVRILEALSCSLATQGVPVELVQTA